MDPREADVDRDGLQSGVVDGEHKMPPVTKGHLRRERLLAKVRYVELVATVGEAALKGAKIPYTSMNGNMYSYLSDNGVGLRLPASRVLGPWHV
jgi:hypothetical protein